VRVTEASPLIERVHAIFITQADATLVLKRIKVAIVFCLSQMIRWSFADRTGTKF